MINITVLFLVIPLAAGMLVGYLLREKKKINLDKTTLAIILMLIFSLGFTIGSDNNLLASIPKVGVSALAMAVSAIAFSVLFVVLARRRLKI
ncbi:MAG TPA: LysO family transporter [Candidatus Bathyarchaeia archaeon]|nr:LysO family transporter [Candidatus Bathyarchaeia archaeon]